MLFFLVIQFHGCNNKGNKNIGKLKDFQKLFYKEILQQTRQIFISQPNLMEEQHILSAALIVGETLLMIGFSNALMVILILSGINLSIFLLLNFAIYTNGSAPNILCPRCKNQSESYLHFMFYCKLFKITLYYISEVI